MSRNCSLSAVQANVHQPTVEYVFCQIHINTHTHTYTHALTNTYVCVHLHVVHVETVLSPRPKQMYIKQQWNAYSAEHIHIQTHTHTSYRHTHTHTHTQIHTHTHVYIHTYFMSRKHRLCCLSKWNVCQQ